MKVPRFSLSLLVLILMLATTNAMAFERTLEKLCQSIHEKTEIKGKDKKSIELKTQLGMRLFPQNYIGVSSNEVDLSSYDTNTPTIIFSMKPDVDSIPDSKTLKKGERKNHKSSLHMQKNLRKLLKTTSESDCLNEAHFLKMTDEELVEYGSVLEKSALNNEYYLANSYQDFAKDAAGNFKNAKVIAVSSEEEIREYLSSMKDEKYNFILIFHADQTGRLYDYSRFVIERDFFRAIKTKAMSVAIFSCYPDAVASYYADEIADLKSSQIAFHRPILKKALKKMNGTPWGLLPEFARQLSHKR